MPVDRPTARVRAPRRMAPLVTLLALTLAACGGSSGAGGPTSAPPEGDPTASAPSTPGVEPSNSAGPSSSTETSASKPGEQRRPTKISAGFALPKGDLCRFLTVDDLRKVRGNIYASTPADPTYEVGSQQNIAHCSYGYMARLDWISEKSVFAFSMGLGLNGKRVQGVGDEAAYLEYPNRLTVRRGKYHFSISTYGPNKSKDPRLKGVDLKLAKTVLGRLP